MARLTETQRDGLEWLYHDGSFRSWASIVPCTPPISSMQALVRKGFALKEGGNGCTPRYAITPAGRSALEGKP